MSEMLKCRYCGKDSDNIVCDKCSTMKHMINKNPLVARRMLRESEAK